MGGITFQRTPYLNLADLFPNLLYTYSHYVYTNKPTNTFVLFFNADKYLGSLRYKLSPYGNIVVNKQYALVGTNGYASNMLQFKGGISASQDLLFLQLKEDINYSLTSQLYENNIIPTSHIRQVHTELDVSCKILSLVYFASHTRYDVLYPIGQGSTDLLLEEADITYHSRNEKWLLGIKGKNLFGRKSFAQSIISPTQRSVVNYALFPRVAMVSVQFRF